MGLMMCSRHGYSGIVPVCPHAQDAGQKHKAGMVIKGVRGPGFLNDGEMTWCEVCIECYPRFPEWKGVKEEEDEWLERFFECWTEVGLVAMCGKCLEDYVRSA